MKLIELHLLVDDGLRYTYENEHIVINPMQISKITALPESDLNEESKNALKKEEPFAAFTSNSVLSPSEIKMIDGDLIQVAESMSYIMALI